MPVYVRNEKTDKVRFCKDIRCASGIFWCW